MFQIRVIGNSFHLIFNYLQYVRLDTGVVAVYLLLHDVVTVCILELVDDRDFFVGSGLRRHLLVIDDDTGMENLLLDSSPKLSATLPTNVPCERLAILEAGIRESNCVLMEVDVSCRLMDMDCLC